MGTVFGSGFHETFSNNLSDNTAYLSRVSGQQMQRDRQRHKHKRLISLGEQAKNNLAFRYLQYVTNAWYVTTQFPFFYPQENVCVYIHIYLFIKYGEVFKGLYVMLSKASMHAEFKIR